MHIHTLAHITCMHKAHWNINHFNYFVAMWHTHTRTQVYGHPAAVSETDWFQFEPALRSLLGRCRAFSGVLITHSHIPDRTRGLART